MKTLDEVIEKIEKMWVCPSSDEAAEYCDFMEVKEDALHYLKEYRKNQEDPDGDHQQLEKCRALLQDFYRNDPLAWDELQQIAGQPVWVECAEETHLKPFWGLVGRYTGYAIPFYTLAPIGEGCSIAYGRKNDMGINWIAYRKERS